MNVQTVVLTDDGADFGGIVIPLTREQVAAARTDGGGNTVTVGFRPEHAALVGAGDGGIPIVVELVEELGSDAYIHGRATFNGTGSAGATSAGATSAGANQTLVVRTSGRGVPRLGETVHVRPDPESLHIFHAATGDRISS